MPMELYQEGSDLRVKQTFDLPAVYFDHWAICEFSDDSALQDRLVAAIHSKGGTFLFSATNLAEFTSASDPRHAEAAEMFLDRLMPHVYLTDFNLEKAQEFESDPGNTGHLMWPSSDLGMLKFLAKRSIQDYQALSFKGFVTLSHEFRDQLNPTFRKTNTNILEVLNKQRANPEFVNLARISVPSDMRSKTQVIMGELLRESFIDPNVKLTTNDVVDLQHATFSVSCCDFVLLDGKWEQRVNSFRRRAEAQGFEIRLAQCFSKRKNGIHNFIQQLEAY